MLMRLDVSQQLRLEQQMKLSPRMIQAMEILQLPLMALQERIDAGAVLQPRAGAARRRRRRAGRAGRAAEEAPRTRGEEPLVVGTSPTAAGGRLSSGWPSSAKRTPRTWSGRSGRGARPAPASATPSWTPWPTRPRRPRRLADYLLEQWAFVEAPEPVKAAGRADHHQHRRRRLPARRRWRSCRRNGGHAGRAPTALPLVQRLDPPGVGARDLRECLLIQLDAEAAAGHDVDLARGCWCAELPARDRAEPHPADRPADWQVSRAEVKAAIASLAQLDPRPGRLIGQRAGAVHRARRHRGPGRGRQRGRHHARRRPAGAAALARCTEDGAGRGRRTPQAKEFLRRNLRSAQWLIGGDPCSGGRRCGAWSRRSSRSRSEFLERGPEALKPLPMTDVAGKVGVHVATVSRAVAGKYVQTPRGIFPLRMFFSGGKTTDGGEDVAWDAIKAKLRRADRRRGQGQPAQRRPDRRRARRQAGITIARRTVAKYRGLLDIPPARQRRKFSEKEPHDRSANPGVGKRPLARRCPSPHRRRPCTPRRRNWANTPT